MSETVSNERVPKKKNFIKTLKAEFKKIIWPDKETLTKQTIAVLISSVVLGAIIAVLDCFLNVNFYLILISGISVYNIPLCF